MNRGEVWWARLGAAAGTRPVLLLSRQKAIDVRRLVTIAPITSTWRGLPSEVALGQKDGMLKNCAINLDSIQTIEKTQILGKITTLSWERMFEVSGAARFALSL